MIVPHRTFLGPAELREQLDSLGTPAILHVRKSELKELPLADVLGDTSEEDGDSWTAGEGFDAYLLGL